MTNDRKPEPPCPRPECDKTVHPYYGRRYSGHCSQWCEERTEHEGQIAVLEAEIVELGEQLQEKEDMQ